MPQESTVFFQNRKCERFPCHQGADPDTFNCLFCYCPLYVLGDRCGGNVIYTEQGIKDCSKCLLPHGSLGYEQILSRFPELAELASRKTGEAP